MNNKYNFIRIFTAVVFIALGIALMRVRANLEFFNLIPSDPPAIVVPLDAGGTYDQVFTVQRKTVSRVGVYMRPLKEISDATLAVNITLLRNGEDIGSGAIPAIFIENGGPSYVTFAQPIATTKGERITIRITVPSALSRAIALRGRIPDATFIQQEKSFFINNEPQEHAVAYNMFETIRPAFVRQAGGILIALGFAMICIASIRRNPTRSALLALFLLALLYAMPALDASMSYTLFAATVFTILVPMWVLLRIAGRTHVAAIFGAAVFACSTWLPLHIITRGNIGGILSVRDALIDPNQIAITHGAGLYTGILVGAVALIGILIWVVMLLQRKFKQCETETIVGIVGLIAASIAFIPSPIANGHAGIVVSFAIAWFASFAAWHSERFLGKNDAVPRIVLTGLALVMMLDLMFVTARAFTYGLGI